MFDPARLWPFNLDRPGKALVAILMLALVAAATLVDFAVAHWARDLPGAVRGFFEIITRAGRSDWFLIPSLLIAGFGGLAARFIAPGRAKVFLTDLATVNAFIFVGTAIPGLLANVFKSLIGRARPVVIDEFGIFHFQPLAWDWRFQSFPSGDTTTIFAFAVVVAFLAPRWRYWALGFAALVGFSRIMVGVHFPSDVLGGLILGTLGAYAMRNLWLTRDWLFMRTPDGRIVRKPAWWEQS